MRNFSKLNINIHGRTSGHVKTFCPFCHNERHDQRDKSLSVDIDNGLYKCHYCGAQGYVPDEEEERRREERLARREKKQNRLPESGKYIRPVMHAEFLIANVLSSNMENQNNRQLRDLITYMTDGRRLTPETLINMRVTVQWHTFHRSEETGQTDQQGKKIYRSVAYMMPVIGFNYFDHGILINTKTRTLDKRFEFTPKAELIPYNIDAILRKEVCYITEGEFDCMTMVQCGFPETISVPNGAQKNLSFLDRFVETHFEDKSRIILALDNDTKGSMLQRELIRRLGEERCRIVTWSDDCKDANEELMKHGMESVIAHVEAAAEIPLTGIQTVEDVDASLMELFLNGKQHGAEIGLQGFDKQLTFETGRYMVVTGRPGDGKSEFVDEICLRLCLRHDWKVAYFSPENTPITYHLAKLFEKLTGFPFQNGGRMTMELYEVCKQWISENICHILPGTDIDPTIDEFNADYQHAIEDQSDRYTLPAILEKARQAISRRGVRILVIDPLNNIEPEPGVEDLKWDRMVNAELRRFARKYHCLVILVAHPRKVNRAAFDGKKRRIEMNDINGSADFGNMSDFCICVDRDDDMKVVNIFVDKVKFKHLGSRGVAHFHYDDNSGRYVPCTLERVAKDTDPAIGPVPGIPGTVCVKNSIGVKYYKTVDWRGFNVRWIGEPLAVSR